MLPDDAVRLLELAGLRPVIVEGMGIDWVAAPKFGIIFISKDLDEDGLRRVADRAFLAAASH